MRPAAAVMPKAKPKAKAKAGAKAKAKAAAKGRVRPPHRGRGVAKRLAAHAPQPAHPRALHAGDHLLITKAHYYGREGQLAGVLKEELEESRRMVTLEPWGTSLDTLVQLASAGNARFRLHLCDPDCLGELEAEGLVHAEESEVKTPAELESLGWATNLREVVPKEGNGVDENASLRERLERLEARRADEEEEKSDKKKKKEKVEERKEEGQVPGEKEEAEEEKTKEGLVILKSKGGGTWITARAGQKEGSRRREGSVKEGKEVVQQQLIELRAWKGDSGADFSGDSPGPFRKGQAPRKAPSAKIPEEKERLQLIRERGRRDRRRERTSRRDADLRGRIQTTSPGRKVSRIVSSGKSRQRPEDGGTGDGGQLGQPQTVAQPPHQVPPPGPREKDRLLPSRQELAVARKEASQENKAFGNYHGGNNYGKGKNEKGNGKGKEPKGKGKTKDQKKGDDAKKS